MLRANVLTATIVSTICFCSLIETTDADDKAETKKPPAVGDKVPDFTLHDLNNQPTSLSANLKNGPVAVIVLRGYPGYQCPICMKQFAELLSIAKKFADAKATVIFIYPGPATDLDKYAKEFVGGKAFPENFRFVVDPDYKFTDLYNLRWNAPKETAYPSSFVVDTKGVVRFAKVSHSHGGRASGTEILEALTESNQ